MHPSGKREASAISGFVQYSPLGDEMAATAALMTSVTRHAGLFLGDRCGIALPFRRSLQIRPWMDIANEIGITGHNIR
ncbi:hypothetical protein [Paracoccus sp. (in: a-proteobacteria)]|jgi:PIN domain nuclease of toxin-antitoxin system|uniref:hypothetical protein n=1 Tax=Paracoccus sp. TaxID=267 RepID=UPI0026DFD51D|nr:hypothetical protein [Paracoccus sp. (in: a-proteobacteria)]MDO5371585.1 hypothetical protein [Paracoccus sp. (in: a-proteobacteria)]